MVEDHARKDITAHEQLGNACDTHHAAMTEGMVLVDAGVATRAANQCRQGAENLREYFGSDAGPLAKDLEGIAQSLREALKVEG
jgi:hypothetical protein